jgi:hypothetical protein
MKSLKLLPTIANVAAGNTVSVNMPVGNTYETIYLYHEGVTPEQIKNIKIELNGRMISEYPNGARLASIDNHYNRKQTAGVLTFNFNRPELHALGNRRFFGLDTNASQGIQTAIISMDIDGDAASPKLKAYAQVVQSLPGAPNFLTKVRRFIVPVSAAGQFDVDTIPKPIGANIVAIHLYMPDGADTDAKCDITKAEMLVDNVNWHDLGADIAADIQTANGRVPQVAESTVIDLILDGDINHALVLTNNIQDFRLRCSATGVGQVEIMVEYIDTWRAGGF